MISFDVDKTYRFVRGAHIITNDIDPLSAMIIAERDSLDMEDTIQYLISEEEWKEKYPNFPVESLIVDFDKYVYLETGEIKIRPYFKPSMHLYVDGGIGPELPHDGIEDKESWNANVSDQVVVKLEFADPDNIGYFDHISYVKIKDRLNLVQLPGDEVLVDKSKNYVAYLVTTDRPGTARLTWKDNLFLFKYEIKELRFRSAAVASL